MRPDKFTSKLQEALADAQSLAVGLDHNYIEPIHLLSALLDQQQGSSIQLLSQAGADSARLKAAVERSLQQLPRVQEPDGEIRLSQDVARIFNKTDKIAQKRGGSVYSQ